MTMTNDDRKCTTVELQPYFESAADSGFEFDQSGYVAGFRGAQGEPWGASIPLDATSVESVVLARANLAIALEVDGHFYIEPSGLDEDAIDAAIKAGHLPRVELQSIVKATVHSDNLNMEENPRAILACLRQQLVAALTYVDAAAADLSK